MTQNSGQTATPQHFSAKIVSGEKSLRVLIFRFTPMGFSFYAPLPQSRHWTTIATHNFSINLPDGTQMNIDAHTTHWKEEDVPGIGMCLVGEADITIPPSNNSHESNLRKTDRVEISQRQPRCIVSHPLLPNLTIEFRVTDLSAQGMKLVAQHEVQALFPQFIFNGHILFPDNTSLQTRFVLKHSKYNSSTQSYSLGAQFLSPSIEFLSTISRKLLSIYNVNSSDLQKSRLFFSVPRRKQDDAANRKQTLKNTLPAKLETREVRDLGEWQNVLQFRLATLKSSGLVDDKASMRSVMSTRDALGKHLVCFFPDGNIAATATILPVTRFGAELRKALPYALHIEQSHERFLDFSQYFASPLHNPQAALESLVQQAIQVAHSEKMSCVAAVVPSEWFDLFESLQSIPHVIEQPSSTQGSPTVFYFFAGHAGERFTQSIHRKEFLSSRDEADISRVFRTFIEKDS